MRLKCICCGFEDEFGADTAFGDEIDAQQAAYEAGWDVAPYFSIQPLCPLCPAAPFAIAGAEKARERHRPMHERWEREGRPEEFDTQAELRLDGASPEDVARDVETVRQLKQLFNGDHEGVSKLKEKLVQQLRRH